MWSRSSGSAGAGSATALKPQQGMGAISNRKVSTTGEHRSGWRVTPGTEEDFARATAPCTAFWLRTLDPHLFMSGRAINHGTSKTSSSTFKLARSFPRATHLAVPGKRRRRAAMRMWRATRRIPLKRKPQRGKNKRKKRAQCRNRPVKPDVWRGACCCQLTHSGWKQLSFACRHKRHGVFRWKSYFCPSCSNENRQYVAERWARCYFGTEWIYGKPQGALGLSTSTVFNCHFIWAHYASEIRSEMTVCFIFICCVASA